MITVGYLVYLAVANPYFMLHFHVNFFFLRRFHYAVFKQPVTEICSVLQLIEKWSTKTKLMLLTKGSNDICHDTVTFLWM